MGDDRPHTDAAFDLRIHHGMSAPATYRCALVVREDVSALAIAALAIVEEDRREEQWLVRDLRTWQHVTWRALVDGVSGVLSQAVQYGTIPRLIVEAGQVGRPVLDLFHAAHREGFLPPIARPPRTEPRDLDARLEILIASGALDFSYEKGKPALGDEAVRMALALVVHRAASTGWVEAWRHSAVAGPRMQPVLPRDSFTGRKFLKEQNTWQ